MSAQSCFKAHLFVFSGTGFCLHEEAPPLQCELGGVQDPLSALNVHIALPGYLPTPSGNTQAWLPSRWRELLGNPSSLSLGRGEEGFSALGTGLSRGGKPAAVNRLRRFRSNPTQDALGMKVKKTS